MTKLIIKGGLLIKNAPPHKVSTLKNRLTFNNPKYVQAKKTGRWISADLPKKLFYYKERGSSIIVPRGMCGAVCKMLNFPHTDVKDFSVAPSIDISFKGKLRDYQEKAVSDVLGRRYGILEAGTGSGKTVMAIAAIAKRGMKTLIIVHNRELLLQWIDRISQFTDVNDIGTIGGGKFEIKDITIGIINSVDKKADLIKKEFGFVIYDECHRTVGDMWVRTINTLYPKFHLGLSATPYRSDKLTKVLFHIVGPIIHKVDKKHLEKTGAILVPEIRRVKTQFTYRFNNDYSYMLSNLTQNEDRNILIANTIINDFKRSKEPMMIVSDRVTHCEVLRYLIDGEVGIRAVVLSGRLPKEYRKQAIKDLHNGLYDALISTIPLLGEGFDSPDLNSVFLTTPMKFSGRTIQTIGRILRPSDSGLMPRVYDFRDILVPTFRNSGFARDRVYKQQGWS